MLGTGSSRSGRCRRDFSIAPYRGGTHLPISASKFVRLVRLGWGSGAVLNLFDLIFQKVVGAAFVARLFINTESLSSLTEKLQRTGLVQQERKICRFRL